MISAVGHETDTTIADFVADLRAPTPSAGAELAVYDVYDLFDEMANLSHRLKRSAEWKLDLAKSRCGALMSKGLAFVTDADGWRISGISGIKPGDVVRVRLQDGTIVAGVKDVVRGA